MWYGIDKISNLSNEANQISDKLLNEIMSRQKDPYTVSEEIIDNFVEVFQKPHVRKARKTLEREA